MRSRSLQACAAVATLRTSTKSTPTITRARIRLSKLSHARGLFEIPRRLFEILQWSGCDYCKPTTASRNVGGPPWVRCLSSSLLRDELSVPRSGGWYGEQVEDQGQRSRAQRDREPRYASPVRPAQRAPPAWSALRVRLGAVWRLL